MYIDHPSISLFTSISFDMVLPLSSLLLLLAILQCRYHSPYYMCITSTKECTTRSNILYQNPPSAKLHAAETSQAIIMYTRNAHPDDDHLRDRLSMPYWIMGRLLFGRRVISHSRFIYLLLHNTMTIPWPFIIIIYNKYNTTIIFKVKLFGHKFSNCVTAAEPPMGTTARDNHLSRWDCRQIWTFWGRTFHWAGLSSTQLFAYLQCGRYM